MKLEKKNLVELITKYKTIPAYSDAKQQEKLIRRKERKWNKRSTIDGSINCKMQGQEAALQWSINQPMRCS